MSKMTKALYTWCQLQFLELCDAAAPIIPLQNHLSMRPQEAFGSGCHAVAPDWKGQGIPIANKPLCDKRCSDSGRTAWRQFLSFSEGFCWDNLEGQID